jgi:hypothetical protein
VRRSTCIQGIPLRFIFDCTCYILRLFITCDHVLQTDKLSFPLGSFDIQCSFTCTYCNIVYAIVCMLYHIGETGLRPGDRFAQHHRTVTKDLGWPISNYFNLPDHRGSIDMRITGMVAYSSSDSDRFRLENRLIARFGCRVPLSINTKHSYF